MKAEIFEFKFNETMVAKNLLSNTDRNKVISFINAMKHRIEFVRFISHLYNQNSFTNPQLPSILQYVDHWERDGMFAIMNLLANKQCLGDIIGKELLTSIIFRATHLE